MSRRARECVKAAIVVSNIEQLAGVENSPDETGLIQQVVDHVIMVPVQTQSEYLGDPLM